MSVKKKISSRKKKCASLMKKAAGNVEMLQGSFIEKYVQCGKARCKCREGEKHGPAYYLSFKEKGVTKLIYIPKNDVKKIKKQIEQFKRYKKIGSDISKINREILKLGKGE